MRKVLIMNLLKKVILLTLVMFVFSNTGLNAFCAQKIIKKDIEVETKDARIIKATLTYPKIDAITKYPTVLLLHSLGHTSADWGNLISYLNQSGYAVIAMDLRGHGKSTYNANLQRKYWTYFSEKAYQKFPDDAVAILKQSQVVSKKVDLNNWAIVGADIGANTAVLTAKMYPKKPKTMVLICPSMNFKGLYIPIAMTEIGTMPILTMASEQDSHSLAEQKTLAKFSQGGFYAKNYSKGGMGMMMIKVNPTMALDITKWVGKYLK
jgi:pimeloyl-ACP methyl ester carboxylesterase